MGDQMDTEKLMAIKELMDELIGDMQPSGEEFDERLGKPKVESVSMELGGDDMPMEGDMAMEGDDPEMDFKNRLMKLK